MVDPCDIILSIAAMSCSRFALVLGFAIVFGPYLFDPLPLVSSTTLPRRIADVRLRSAFPTEAGGTLVRQGTRFYAILTGFPSRAHRDHRAAGSVRPAAA